MQQWNFFQSKNTSVQTYDFATFFQMKMFSTQNFIPKYNKAFRINQSEQLNFDCFGANEEVTLFRESIIIEI